MIKDKNIYIWIQIKETNFDHALKNAIPVTRNELNILKSLIRKKHIELTINIKHNFDGRKN